MKEVTEFTRKDFEALPYREWGQDIGEFSALVILPLRKIHESNWRCMDFIAVKENIPTYRLSGCSDVIHLNGIGGWGKLWLDKSKGIPKLIPPCGWEMDCLKKSGLLRLFANTKLTAGEALSSFEIYTKGE